jgi:hypothetical protein
LIVNDRKTIDMGIQTKTRTELVLTVMHILTWVAFIGLMIKAGAILVSYGISWVNPVAAGNLYLGLNLYNLSQFSFGHYTLFVSLMVILLCMKALICFLIIKTLSKVKLMNPFTMEVARTLERISLVLMITWAFAVAGSAHTAWLMERTGTLRDDGAAGEFIFMAGLVFIISQVFKRGVEIQSENDLTV